MDPRLRGDDKAGGKNGDDRRKESFIKNIGIKLVRYTNIDIKNNLDEVVEHLFNIINNLKESDLTPPIRRAG